MTAIDRPGILGHLRNQQGKEEFRARFYSSTPYPAMVEIASDRAYSWRLLADAVEAGLLEKLAAAADCASAAQRAELHLTGPTEEQLRNLACRACYPAKAVNAS